MQIECKLRLKLFFWDVQLWHFLSLLSVTIASFTLGNFCPGSYEASSKRGAEGVRQYVGGFQSVAGPCCPNRSGVLNPSGVPVAEELAEKQRGSRLLDARRRVIVAPALDGTAENAERLLASESPLSLCFSSSVTSWSWRNIIKHTSSHDYSDESDLSL